MCGGNTTERMEKKQEPTSKELLQLERESNPLQTRLRVVQNGSKSGDQKRKTPPTSLPDTSVLDRVRAFLPIMDEANRKLMAGIEEKGQQEFDIEAVSANGAAPHIEMDLALGIADLNTPEALAAAERATAGQMHEMDVDEDSSEDDSEDDPDDNTEKIATKSRSKAKKVNIIES